MLVHFTDEYGASHHINPADIQRIASTRTSTCWNATWIRFLSGGELVVHEGVDTVAKKLNAARKEEV